MMFKMYGQAWNLPVCGVHEHSAAKSLKLSEEKDSQGITRELLRAAKINAEEQRQIYTQFITRSRPHVCFKKRQFGEFMTMLGWSVEHLQALFRSFDSQRHGCLSFKHFIMGLAAVEPTIEHGGTPAEIRCRYIFRYYDSNQDNKISFREFRSMVADIRRCKGQTLSLDELQREAEKSAMVFGSESRATLGLHEFLTAVGQLKFRGTSLLLRSPISILRYLAGVGLHEPVLANGPAGEGGGKSPRSISSDKSGPFSRSSGLSIAQLGPGGGGISPVSGNPAAVTESPFLPPRVPRLGESFELAAHSVKVKKTGMVVNVSTLWDFEGTEAINGTLNIQRDTSFNRLHSFECFSDSFLPNDILKALRYFERSIKGAGASACAPVPFSAATAPGSKASGSTKSPKDAFTWGREIQKTALAQSILQLCHQVEEIFAQEPRLITITSPVYVLGDLHGNYEDLMCFEKVLWRLGPLLTPASFLFLGDYVDRGAHGLEVVSYLFAQKMVAPHKFFLLRGNHELRVVQKTFTFYDECLNAFGDTLGKEVWEAVNKAFDNMPLAAVIDKKIFCVHGGIPPPYMGGGMVNAILDIPCPLKEPEKEAPLAWEIMWNDPVSLETIWPPEAANTIRQNQGFGPNTKRGTAHVFSEDALQDFLGRNSLSHVIRAHEVQQSGFQLQPCGRCLTVFSSSHYCGASNEAACILCENMKLRVIRLDTA
ncbi:unnamed protein product [Cyprideis torosa]|uniref:Serine/threonine-protein phosphatase n=1 Tax=Cyprideis torosa TaxID=163714 RepID=A0A7R8WJW7_9CRUS|nr:unnamed protein product [Cyprideis torosa]CAG0896443.1 unnamed protein product [Cyprideis torosa]